MSPRAIEMVTLIALVVAIVCQLAAFFRR